MTIVDAHHHVWDLSVRLQPWLDQPGLAPLRRNFLLSDLEPEAAAEGVTSTVLVQTVTEPDETPEMLALAAGSDLIAGVVGWVDLEAPGAGDAIGALRELCTLACVGRPPPRSRNCRTPACPVRYRTTRPRNDRLSRAIAATSGIAAMSCPAASRSAAKLSLPPSR